MDEKAQELSDLQEMSQSDRRKNHEMVSSLFRDLNEVSSALGTKAEDRLRAVDSSTEITDEDFARWACTHSTRVCTFAFIFWLQS